MGDPSQCNEIAVQEVINAIRIINQREGSNAADILYTLDKLHGKVERPVIKQALKTAVHRGILMFHHGRFSICNRKGSRRKGSKKNRIGWNSVHQIRCLLTDSNYSVPVRNYECNFVKRAKSTNRCLVKDSYSFREIERPLQCQCYSDDEMSSLNGSSDMSDCCNDKCHCRNNFKRRRKQDINKRKPKVLSHHDKRKNVNLKNVHRNKGYKRNSPSDAASKSKRKRKIINNQNGGDKNNNEEGEKQCTGESSKTIINYVNTEKSEQNKSSTEGTIAEDPKGEKDKPSNDKGYMGMYANLSPEQDNYF